MRLWPGQWKTTLLTGLYKLAQFSGKRPPTRVSEAVVFTVETDAGTAHVHIVHHARATRLRLSEKRDGHGFRLTLPPRYPQAKAVAWAADHAGWMALRMRAAGPGIVQEIGRAHV